MARLRERLCLSLTLCFPPQIYRLAKLKAAAFCTMCVALCGAMVSAAKQVKRLQARGRSTTFSQYAFQPSCFQRVICEPSSNSLSNSKQHLFPTQVGVHWACIWAGQRMPKMTLLAGDLRAAQLCRRAKRPRAKVMLEDFTVIRLALLRRQASGWVKWKLPLNTKKLQG